MPNKSFLLRHLPAAPSKPACLRAVPTNSILVIALLATINVVVWAVSAVILAASRRENRALIPSAALSYSLGLRHALDADHISAIDLVTRRLLASERYSSSSSITSHQKSDDDDSSNTATTTAAAATRKRSLPATVGTFFSLGHSTVVIVTCVVVAATSGALRDRFDGFARIGNIVGSAVSAAFLILLCAGNGCVLYKLVRRLRRLLAQRRCQGPSQDQQQQQQDGVVFAGSVPPTRSECDDNHEATPASRFPPNNNNNNNIDTENSAPGGFMARILGFLFKAIDRPWKMYPLGVVFGLGFDTSSEIAILGIASIHAVQGTSIWLILIFPILFTSGMCLLDTTDGALMMALYSSTAFSRDQVAILYYSIVLTGITVFVAAFIGIIQLLTLIQNVAVRPHDDDDDDDSNSSSSSRFWNGVSAVSDHFDIVGGCIVAVFVLAGLVSVIVYRPWRRRFDRNRQALAQAANADLRDADGPQSPPSSQDEEAAPRHVVT